MKDHAKIRRRSEAQIRELLSLQAKSGMAVIRFCQARKIHKATFYNWRNKYSGTPEKQLEEFVPLRLAEPGYAAVATPFAEVELSSKVCIRLFQKVEPSYFKSLLQP